MASQYSDLSIEQALITVEGMSEAIDQLLSWNENIESTDDFRTSPHGMQLLAANCMMITALGEYSSRIF